MFNQRRNKRFSYQSRLQETDKGKSNDDLKAKWEELKATPKRSGSVLTSLPALIIMLILLFVLIYILDGYIK